MMQFHLRLSYYTLHGSPRAIIHLLFEVRRELDIASSYQFSVPHERGPAGSTAASPRQIFSIPSRSSLARVRPATGRRRTHLATRVAISNGSEMEENYGQTMSPGRILWCSAPPMSFIGCTNSLRVKGSGYLLLDPLSMSHCRLQGATLLAGGSPSSRRSCRGNLSTPGRFYEGTSVRYERKQRLIDTLNSSSTH